MGLASRVKLFIRAALGATSPYTSGGVAETNVDQVLGSGTTISNADKCAKWTTSTATNTDISIRSQADANGIACNFAEIVAMVFETPTTNPGDIQIKPAAANGWVSLLANSSDILILKPGTTLVVFCPAAAAYAMGASTDTINVASTSGTSAVTITAIGRSA